MLAGAGVSQPGAAGPWLCLPQLGSPCGQLLGLWALHAGYDTGTNSLPKECLGRVCLSWIVTQPRLQTLRNVIAHGDSDSHPWLSGVARGSLLQLRKSRSRCMLENFWT